MTEKNFTGMVTVGGMLATHHECGMFSSLDKTVASCQLVDTDYTVLPNTHRRRRRDSTVELSRVGGVYAPVVSRDPVSNFLRQS